MAAQIELFDLPDPGELPEDLENFGGGSEDWVSLFLEDSCALEDLPDCADLLLSNDASRSPISGVTQHSGSSSPTHLKDEEAGSGTEQCRSDSKPSSSGESDSVRSTKRLGKRKVDYDDDKLEDGEADEEEVKRMARLMRNRESAQLSRQRKKAYVDDLEERVRTLNATVAELNNTVSLISAENVNLRNQLAYYYSSSGGSKQPGAYPPPMGVPVYHYPGPGGYVLRPGSSAPPVPIPRLKTQASAVKSAKRAKVSKQETAKKPSPPATSSGKAKRLSSVAALGLLCLIAVVFPFDFGIPVVERAGMSVSSNAGQARIGGRVLMSLEDEYNRTSQVGWSSRDDKLGCDRADRHGAVIDGSMFPANVSTYGNASYRFPTSLRFPRDNQVVKIDGDLIIQAVMAGDKAATKQVSSPGGDQSHAVALLKSGVFRDIAAQALARTPLPALPPSDGNGEDPRRNLGNDLTGSGLCNEVFQFEINPDPQPGEPRSSSARRNANYRRNLSAVPLPSSPTGSGGKKLNSSGALSHTRTRSQPSSMVVSIFNPKPEQHSGGTAKDLARIFVVVLVDSVKYVTYSCLLPPQPRVVTG